MALRFSTPPTPSSSLLHAALVLALMGSMVPSVNGDYLDGYDNDRSIFSSRYGIDTSGSMLALSAIVMGGILCLGGYKLLKFSMFMIGFVLGGVLLEILAGIVADDSVGGSIIKWIAFFFGGLVVGILMATESSCGMFCVGGAAGIVLAALMHTSVTYKVSHCHPNTVLTIVAIALGIVGGVLTVKCKKPALIVAINVVGSALAVWGAGYFAGNYPLANNLKRNTQNYNTNIRYPDLYAQSFWIPTAWWTYLVVTVILFFLGCTIQFATNDDSERDGQDNGVSTSLPVDVEVESPFDTLKSPQQQETEATAPQILVV